jgi:hypothetical protein
MAAVAPGPGAARRSDHVRGPGGHRRLADDGVAGGPSGPDRPRGRLRDPVPGPVRGVVAGGLVPNAGRGGGGGPGRPRDRHGGARDRRGVPGAAAVADPAGSRLRPPARVGDRARVRARAHGRARDALARQTRRAAKRGSAGPHEDGLSAPRSGAARKAARGRGGEDGVGAGGRRGGGPRAPERAPAGSGGGRWGRRSPHPVPRSRSPPCSRWAVGWPAPAPP